MTSNGQVIDIDLSQHFTPKLMWLPSFYESDYRYIVLKGGRGGAKSYSTGKALVFLSITGKYRFLCLRERQNSIEESSKETLEQVIRDCGLDDYFDITRTRITARNTKSEFIFKGLSNETAASIKSYQSIDVAWLEEAQAISARSWDILEPTVRDENSKIVITYNPTNPTDIVHQLFGGTHPPPDAYVQHVNYTDNPFRAQVIDDSAAFFKERRPQEYAHVWLGETMPDIGTTRVLRMDVLQKCVDLYEDHAHLMDDTEGYEKVAGYDVADLGEDMCALAIRRGPFLVSMQQWRGYDNAIDGVRRLDRIIVGEGIWRVYYDASGGYGVSVRSGIQEIADKEGRRPYSPRPVQFGGAVGGKDAIYDYRYTNAQMFAWRNAQMAWALRLRADNTMQIANDRDADIDPRECLFINPAIIDARETADLLIQLNQPLYDTRDGGKVRLTKAEPTERSPDMFDALCLAFAGDSENGLRI